MIDVPAQITNLVATSTIGLGFTGIVYPRIKHVDKYIIEINTFIKI